jgi:hypothetical protein
MAVFAVGDARSGSVKWVGAAMIVLRGYLVLASGLVLARIIMLAINN